MGCKYQEIHICFVGGLAFGLAIYAQGMDPAYDPSVGRSQDPSFAKLFPLPDGTLPAFVVTGTNR